MRWHPIAKFLVVSVLQFMVAFTVAGGQDDRVNKSVAIVTGFIGSGPAYVPALPHPILDCYFITNNLGLGEFATESNWKVIYLEYIPLVDSSLSLENEKVNSANSKPLRVHPQRLLPKHYDFIAWFDNKYELSADLVLHSIAHWVPHVAMMLPPRPECCGADLEFKAAMMQPRYAVDGERIEAYMIEQAALGFPVHGERHMRTGFLIYNMNHPDTITIQDLWQDHIDQTGIMCQIAFYFVAQRFPTSIQEYSAAWHSGSRYGFIRYEYDTTTDTTATTTV